jgi:hypothetical protein
MCVTFRCSVDPVDDVDRAVRCLSLTLSMAKFPKRQRCIRALAAMLPAEASKLLSFDGLFVSTMQILYCNVQYISGSRIDNSFGPEKDGIVQVGPKTRPAS